MSFHFHTIVDQHATAESAWDLAQRVLNWLTQEQIVERQKSDCLFSKEGGYAPGPRFRDAIESLHEEYIASFLGCTQKGLDIITTRTVFHAGEGPIDLVCNQCARRYEAPPSWGDAVGQWYDGDDDARLACSFCNQMQLITQWKHIPTYGFGHLGFRFMNWPELMPSFAKKVAELLGHPVIVVSGRI